MEELTQSVVGSETLGEPGSSSAGEGDGDSDDAVGGRGVLRTAGEGTSMLHALGMIGGLLGSQPAELVTMRSASGSGSGSGPASGSASASGARAGASTRASTRSASSRGSSRGRDGRDNDGDGNDLDDDPAMPFMFSTRMSPAASGSSGVARARRAVQASRSGSASESRARGADDGARSAAAAAGGISGEGASAAGGEANQMITNNVEQLLDHLFGAGGGGVNLAQTQTPRRGEGGARGGGDTAASEREEADGARGEGGDEGEGPGEGTGDRGVARGARAGSSRAAARVARARAVGGGPRGAAPDNQFLA